MFISVFSFVIILVLHITYQKELQMKIKRILTYTTNRFPKKTRRTGDDVRKSRVSTRNASEYGTAPR